jgi:hypothetical protein
MTNDKGYTAAPLMKEINIVCSNPETERRVSRLENAYGQLAKINGDKLVAAETKIDLLVTQNMMLKDGIQALHIKLKSFEIPIIDEMCKNQEAMDAESYLNLCFPPTMMKDLRMNGNEQGTRVC